MAKNKNTNTFSDEMNKSNTARNSMDNITDTHTGNSTKNRTANYTKNRQMNRESDSSNCHRGGESNYSGTNYSGR